MPNCEKVLSRRDFARYVRRSEATVSRWISSGRLSGAALAAGGKKIVITEALDQLALTTGPEARPVPVRRVVSLEIARLKRQRAALALEEAERRAAAERARLVDAAEVARIFARERDKLIASVEALAVGIAAALGHNDRASIDAARREFRAWRDRRAAQLHVAAPA